MAALRLEAGSGIVLRPWETGDLDGLVRQADSRQVRKNLRDRFPSPYTEQDGLFFLQEIVPKDPEHHFAVIVGGEVAGGMGLEPFHDDRAGVYELGYWLGESFWGRGIMSRALGALLRHGFITLRAHRLEAFVFPWNPVSRRILAKHGFVREGITRSGILKAGAWVDMERYGLLAEEYMSGYM